MGPDLANFGRRAGKSIEDATAGLDRFLYAGSATHPSYKFLFEKTAVSGERSARALTAPGGQVQGNEQVVPSERAQTLVSYLLSLSTAYDYPESRPVVPAAEPEKAKEEHKK